VLQPALLRTVAENLDSAGIDYMMTGSIVSSLQGEPSESGLRSLESQTFLTE
jgi:hypothetical protein